MVNVYNADRINVKNRSFILKHLGISSVAAAERIEGMFAHQAMCSFNPDLSVNVHDRKGKIIASQTLNEHLLSFCDYAKTFSISEYSIAVKNPLRLLDLWGDDPIGSAGPQVVDTKQLTSSQTEDIQKLFYPFSSVIYPPQILSIMSLKDIKNIKRRYLGNKFFEAEFKKRKFRSKAVGEDFNQAQYQEIVWLDFTFKLKSWALNNGFDSFVYSNNKEGNGEDTYITLFSNQVTSTSNALFFQEEKYLSEMPEAIKKMITSHGNGSYRVINHALWGQKDPMCYWK
ncbi:hypothetical protein ACU5DF_02550 [Aliivibrio wodanis]|uniref:hypothetical protein n=1 Tax=Aliivibrio wodanis TaxID=80852 RepID=UPI00406CCD63